MFPSLALVNQRRKGSKGAQRNKSLGPSAHLHEWKGIEKQWHVIRHHVVGGRRARAAWTTRFSLTAKRRTNAQCQFGSLLPPVATTSPPSTCRRKSVWLSAPMPGAMPHQVLQAAAHESAAKAILLRHRLHASSRWSRDLVRKTALLSDRPSRSPSPVAVECLTAEQAVRELRCPSHRLYVGLKRKFADPDWTLDFLRQDGLDVLFCSLALLDRFSLAGGLTGALVQLECVQCVKAVMDSRIGLDYIVDNKEYTQKLATVLDTTNVTVKKQVFELLSALCVYNVEGYNRTLEALENYKELKSERYRFRLVVEELRHAQTCEYKTTLVAFINCIILSTPLLKDRIRIRNEFIGLKILEVINQLRRDELGEDLSVQLDVFEDERYKDESQITGPHGVDLNSHQDVFYAILRQVIETPQEIPFLSILQHLLRIDPKEAISDIVWDTAETLVHRATLLDNKEDQQRLLRSPSHRSLSRGRSSCCQCSCHADLDNPRSRRRSTQWGDGGRTPTVMSPLTSSSPSFPPTSPPPPPPPPLPGTGPAPPPPPPPPPSLHSGGPPPPPPPMNGSIHPPPPPPPLLGSAPSPTKLQQQGLDEVDGITLPQQATPKPKAKMRTLNWTKLPNHKVMSDKDNIWSSIARSHKPNDVNLNFDELEGLFCQGSQQTHQGQGSPKLGRESSSESERRRREPTEINLLDGKRSLNINIFLKQFRSSNEEIISLIREGSHDDIGSEKLRGLMKILPEADEVEMLRSFDGDRTKLGNAEKFLLQLLQVSNYKLRIESMLLKEEFASQLGFLEPSINAMMLTAHDLKENGALQEVLFMVLVAGNFLNSGGYAGNAAGFKMTSLQKLTDIRANKPGMNLIHYVAMQAEKRDKNLLKFPEDMQYLEEAAKTSIDQLKGDILQLDQRVTKISGQVVHAEADIREQMEKFLEIARQEIVNLHEDLIVLERVRQSLAEFFCEDLGSFKLEECFKTFHGFCVKFKAAVEENEKRRKSEAQAEARRRQREEQQAMRRRTTNGDPRPPSMSGSESDTNLVDYLLSDVRSGFAQRRIGEPANFKVKKVKKTTLESLNGNITSEDEPSITNSPRVSRRRIGSMGSQAGGNDQVFSANGSEVNSPDVTPNGTMRRRRSRNPSEENDENLLDFLRQGTEITEGRDRWSWGSLDGYGSLDRSFGRRSRRKRPDLFEFERERPASPAPPASPSIIEPRVNGTELPSEEEPPPRQWRQKIEAWLQENEKEEERGRQLKEKAKERQLKDRLDRARNKSDFEPQHESDAKTNGLQTLHEDKADVYKPVYANRWRSSLDNTDIEKVLEVVEGYQDPKDKSQWRKSSLNLPNTRKDEAAKGNRLRAQSDTNTLRLYFKNEIEPNQQPAASDQPPKQSQEVTPVRRRSNTIQDSTNENNSSNSPRSSLAYRSFRGSGEVQEDILNTILEHEREQELSPNSHGVEKRDERKKETATERATSVPWRKKAAELSSESTATQRQDSSPRNTPEGQYKGDADSENIETPPTPRRLRRFRNSLELSDYSAPSTPTEMKTEPQFTAQSTETKPTLPSTTDQSFKATEEEEDDLKRTRSLRRSLRYQKLLEMAQPPEVIESPAKPNQSTPTGDEDEMGDGQFDRFAAIRRTRRFRRPVDASADSQAEPSGKVASKESETASPECGRDSEREARLKRWRDRLQTSRSEESFEKELLASVNNSNDSKTHIDQVLRDIENTGKELQLIGLEKPPSPVQAEKKKTEEKAVRNESTLNRIGSARAKRDAVSSLTKETAVRPTSLPLESAKRKESAEEKTFKSTYVLTPSTPSPTSEPVKPNRLIRCTSITSKDMEETLTKIDGRKDSDVTKRLKNTQVNTTQETSKSGVAVINGSSKPRTMDSAQIPNKQNSLRKSMKNAQGKSQRSPEQTDTEPERDEGFEETQSLVSESTSQGASSSCNYDTDIVDSPRSLRHSKVNPMCNETSEKVKTIDSKLKSIDTKSEEKPSTNSMNKSKLGSFQRTLRPSSLRVGNKPLVPSLSGKGSSTGGFTRQMSTPVRSRIATPSNLPTAAKSNLRRTPSRGSLRGSRSSLRNSNSSLASHNGSTKGVERSGSRSSLKSSRSSLSSVVTVATARQRSSPSTQSLASTTKSTSVGDKNNKNKISGYTNAIKTLTKNLRKSKALRGEDFESTQSMPVTPSDENKTFLSSSRKVPSSNSLLNSNGNSPQSQSPSTSNSSVADKPVTVSKAKPRQNGRVTSQVIAKRPLTALQKTIRPTVSRVSSSPPECSRGRSTPSPVGSNSSRSNLTISPSLPRSRLSRPLMNGSAQKENLVRKSPLLGRTLSSSSSGKSESRVSTAPSSRLMRATAASQAKTPVAKNLPLRSSSLRTPRRITSKSTAK